MQTFQEDSEAITKVVGGKVDRGNSGSPTITAAGYGRNGVYCSIVLPEIGVGNNAGGVANGI